MSDQELAVQAISEAQHILKGYLEQNITTTKGYSTGWSRCLNGPPSSSPSIACDAVLRRLLTPKAKVKPPPELTGAANRRCCEWR